MSRRLTRPYFPVPPADYNQRYFSEVIRSFSVFLEQVQNPGDLRATTLTLTDLQSNDVGLEPGALFQQNGFVKVTLINAPNPSGVGTTTGVGAVTVVTT
jgi:hypothetical protein